MADCCVSMRSEIVSNLSRDLPGGTSNDVSTGSLLSTGGSAGSGGGGGTGWFELLAGSVGGETAELVCAVIRFSCEILRNLEINFRTG